MPEIRRRAEILVQDPATAESLKAWYRQFCKRPCFRDEYLRTFNRPIVHLVDTGGQASRVSMPLACGRLAAITTLTVLSSLGI